MTFRRLIGILGLAVVVLGGGAIATAFTQTPDEPFEFSTLAGSMGGAGNVDGSGSDARFRNPVGVAVDGDGNVYVADSANHVIRRISPAGSVSTLAGSAGQCGSADGTAGNARLCTPYGVAVDGAGNVYVAEASSDTIRKITATGQVTTLAGQAGYSGSADGTGSAARFLTPLGVAVDAAGNVYVADAGNDTIRKISPEGVVTTLAGLAGQSGSSDGTGSEARFWYPTSVTCDGSGTVRVADTYNHTVRMITPGGVVTTLAGYAGDPGSRDGTGDGARFDYPRGVAVDGSGNVYVADMGSHTIRKITPSAVVTTLAGRAGNNGSVDGSGGDARFSSPWGVAASAAGLVFVSDTENHTVRQVTPAGLVTTLAGRPSHRGSNDDLGSAARFSSPRGVAVDGSGNLYVADVGNHTIRKIASTGLVSTVAGRAGDCGSADGWAGDARFCYPHGVAVDDAGNLYVADKDNHTIRRISPGGVVSTLAGLAGSSGSDDGTGADARFQYPYGIAVDGAGTVYVADSINSTIRKITPAGVVSTLAGLAGSNGDEDGPGSEARFSYPFGVAVDGAGNVFVADGNNSTIRKITSAGVVTTLAGSHGACGQADGAGRDARFCLPHGVAADQEGNVLVADTENHEIRRITPTGTVTTLAGRPGAAGGADGTGAGALFSSPYGIAVNRAGQLYVADSDNNAIRAGQSAGSVTPPETPSGPGSGQVGVDYAFTTGGSTSSVGHPVQYRFDWGDGTDSGWLATGATGAAKSWPGAGSYEVRAQARSAVNVAVESALSAGRIVAIAAPPASGPDLTGWWNSLTHSCKTKKGVQKCTIKGKFTVRNEGDQAAGSSRLTWRLSIDAVADASDRLLKTSTVSNLKPTKKKSLSLSYALAPGTTAAGLYLVVVLDAGEALRERDETNNQFARGPM